MADSLYYYYEYSPELGGKKLKTKIYSDTTISLLDLASKEGLPPSPMLTSINPIFKTELSKNLLITTTVARQQVNRVVHRGDFIFSGYEMIGGTINESIIVLGDGTVFGKIYSSPIPYQQVASVGAYKAISSFSGQSFTSFEGFAQLFPVGWTDNPFGQNLVSASGASASTNFLSTSSSVDALTGVSKTKDVFQFSAEPGFGDQKDSITNFSTKDKDSLQFSKSAFGLSTGRFAIAKTQKKLDKLLATDVNIVYFKPKGELIFNANGPEAGFGIDGGVFAQLVGAPKLIGGSVSFV